MLKLPPPAGASADNEDDSVERKSSIRDASPSLTPASASPLPTESFRGDILAASADDARPIRNTSHGQTGRSVLLEDPKLKPPTDSRGLVWRQLLAIFHIRWATRVRTMLRHFHEILVPVMFIAVALLLASLLEKTERGEEIYADDAPNMLRLQNRIGQILSKNADIEEIKLALNNSLDDASEIIEVIESEPIKIKSRGDYCYRSSDPVIDTAEFVYNYDGPFPVPDFDTYVSLHENIDRFISEDLSSRLDKLAIVDNRFGNLVFLGKLTFAAGRPDLVGPVNDFVEYMQGRYKTFDRFFGGVKASEDKAVKASQLAERVDGNRTWAVLVFDEFDFDTRQFDYTIRMNYSVLPSTNLKYSHFNIELDRDYLKYYYSGFLTLQRTVELYIADVLNVPTPAVIVGAPMPTTTHIDDLFYESLAFFMGLFFVSTALMTVTSYVKSVYAENEFELKLLLQTMGMEETPSEISWFILHLFVFGINAFVYAALSKVTIWPNSDLGLLFILFLLLFLCLISFTWLVSVFVANGKLTAVAAPIILFLMALPRFIFFDISPQSSTLEKVAACTMAPTCFMFGADLIGQREEIEFGMNWDNVSEGEFSMGTVFTFLAIDLILHIVLAWYFKHVLPNEFGRRYVLYFPFSPVYWRNDPPFAKRSSDDTLHRVLEGMGAFENHADLRLNGWVEDDSEFRGKALVEMRKITKIYDTGRGVNIGLLPLSMNLYKNEMTAVVGHPGCGKSTLVKLLLGLLEPDHGSCTVCGFSIEDGVSSIQKRIGYCPAENMLNSVLTVKQHLQLFARVKGVVSKEVDKAVENMLRKVRLTSVQDKLTKDLTGTQERKLSVALALIGDPKVVLLDNPTLGMDWLSRKRMFRLLARFKVNRTILIVTQYIEEAAKHVDRFAILSKGKLEFWGSPDYLMGKYGIGYTLQLVRHIHNNSMEKEANVLALIEKHIKNQATLVDDDSVSLTFQFPLSVTSFWPLLKALDQSKASEGEDLGIADYTLYATTIDDVFMRVTSADDMDRDAAQENIDMIKLGERSSQRVHRHIFSGDLRELATAVKAGGLTSPPALLSPSGSTVVETSVSDFESTTDEHRDERLPGMFQNFNRKKKKKGGRGRKSGFRTLRTKKARTARFKSIVNQMMITSNTVANFHAEAKTDGPLTRWFSDSELAEEHPITIVKKDEKDEKGGEVQEHKKDGEIKLGGEEPQAVGLPSSKQLKDMAKEVKKGKPGQGLKKKKKFPPQKLDPLPKLSKQKVSPHQESGAGTLKRAKEKEKRNFKPKEVKNEGAAGGITHQTSSSSVRTQYPPSIFSKIKSSHDMELRMERMFSDTSVVDESSKPPKRETELADLHSFRHNVQETKYVATCVSLPPILLLLFFGWLHLAFWDQVG